MVALPEHLTRGPVGQRKLAREVIEEQQRQRILDAATEVFAKRGFLSTTVDNIVSAAKIGVANFYSNFDGKEDCFLQAYERNVGFAREGVAERVPADAEWPEQACAVLVAALELIVANPLRARLLLVEAQTAGNTALRRYEETIDGLVPMLRQGRAHCPVADELPDTLEVAIFGGLLWFLQQRVVHGELDTIEGRFPEVADIVLMPYLGREQTDRVLRQAVQT
jgi:AcrR family transcriptional regulator